MLKPAISSVNDETRNANKRSTSNTINLIASSRSSIEAALTDESTTSVEHQQSAGMVAAKVHNGTSNLETLMHIIKANIGTGVLAMPLAFKNAGLILSGVSLWIMAAICVHCMHILLRAYQHVMSNRRSMPNDADAKSPAVNIGYDDVVEMAVREKCNVNSKVPSWARAITSIFLVIGQLGFCCVYLVFVPTNLKQVIDFYYPHSGLSVELVMCMVVVPLVPFCMIKNLKVLAPFSAVANALMICSMLVIMFELFFYGEFKSMKELDMVAQVATWPTYFSSAIYAFEGISLILPVYHEMQNKTDFAPWNGVLNTAMSLVAIMYFSIGFFGYMKYGKEAMASITLNLPVSSVVFQIIKILFAIAIFISYNLQFYVAAEIIWSYIFRSSQYLQRLKLKREQEAEANRASSSDDACMSAGKKLGSLENLFRASLVLGTFLLAIAIPKIELFIALVGAVASSTLAIIIPPLLELLLFWHLSTHPKLNMTKNLLIILFGAYIFLAGTYLSISDIVDYFVKHS